VPVRNDVGPDGPVVVPSRPQLDNVAPTGIAIASFAGLVCGRSFLNRLWRRPGFDNEPITMRIVILYLGTFCDDPPGVQPS
jgi:hypothetical protein